MLRVHTWMLRVMQGGFDAGDSIPMTRKPALKIGDKNPEGIPILGFGQVLEREKIIHGGAVKLLSLKHGFACDEQRSNILYLVSSAQPDSPWSWVKECRHRGGRFVWNQNGVGYPAWAGWQTGRHNRPMRRLRKAADFIVYQSEFCRRSADRFLGPVDCPSRVLLNPVNLERFTPLPEPPSLETVRLLVIGTQNYAARVLNALDALAELRTNSGSVRMTIAGQTLWRNAERAIARRIRDLGLEGLVDRHPAFTRDEAVVLYRSHHILVHAKYMDPCPTVVAEALACGLPVVASASGGLPEMTTPACARLIPVPEDWKRMYTPAGRELAAAICDLLSDWASASSAARAHALKTFDQKKWIAAHAEIFEDLLHTP